jgi:transcription antitermination factor NusG
VFQSAGAVRYLFWLGKPAIVRDEEIGTIKKWLETPDGYDFSIDSIQVGDKITLESGPFSAQEAVVREVNKTHYVLVLESLGCVLKMKHV